MMARSLIQLKITYDEGLTLVLETTIEAHNVFPNIDCRGQGQSQVSFSLVGSFRVYIPFSTISLKSSLCPSCHSFGVLHNLLT